MVGGHIKQREREGDRGLERKRERAREGESERERERGRGRERENVREQRVTAYRITLCVVAPRATDVESPIIPVFLRNGDGAVCQYQTMSTVSDSLSAGYFPTPSNQ